MCLPAALWSVGPEAWIPARWPGGPLEVERRVRSKSPLRDTSVREVLENWYDPSTLGLLEGSPINCLLVTWSTGTSTELDRRQQRLVKPYIAEAHKRGLAVLGVVNPGPDASGPASAAADAALDGLVLEGDIPSGFAEETKKTLAAAGSTAVVIPIARDARTVRAAKELLLAIEGVPPSSRSLAEMGIRAGPSSEPWIEFNIWLVRSFRSSSQWRPVWVSQQPVSGSAADYARAVADAAVAGGRWIVALDDGLRVRLRRRDPTALEVWRRIGATIRFAEQHADWGAFTPYGNLAIIVDSTSSDDEMTEECLKLVARRQTPYRLLERQRLNAQSLAGFRAVLATQIPSLTGAERKTLREFAERGGLVIAGPGWGAPPRDQPYSETPLGKGRVVVYKDPDPESVARDTRDLLSQEEMGVTSFNVPSVITHVSDANSGRRVLIQLLNYSNSPATAITIRVQRGFRTARLYTPDSAPADLTIRREEGHTDVAIPKLPFWGGVLLE